MYNPLEYSTNYLNVRGGLGNVAGRSGSQSLSRAILTDKRVPAFLSRGIYVYKFLQRTPSTEGFYRNKPVRKNKSVKINSQKSSRCNQTVTHDIKFLQQTIKKNYFSHFAY